MNKYAFQMGEQACLDQVFGPSQQEKTAAIGEFLKSLHPRELKALLAAHPNLGVRASEAGIGAGLGAAGGYATGQDEGLFQEGTHGRNALIGAGLGAGAGIGASALSRNLMTGSLRRGFGAATKGLKDVETPIGQEAMRAADTEALDSAMAKLQANKDKMESSLFGLGGKERLQNLHAKVTAPKETPKAPVRKGALTAEEQEAEMAEAHAASNPEISAWNKKMKENVNAGKADQEAADAQVYSE